MNKILILLICLTGNQVWALPDQKPLEQHKQEFYMARESERRIHQLRMRRFYQEQIAALGRQEKIDDIKEGAILGTCAGLFVLLVGKIAPFVRTAIKSCCCK